MLHDQTSLAPRSRAAHDGYRSVAQTQDELLRQHSELVRRIAWHVHSRMSSSVELEDLIQVGLMALIECARTYEDRGFAFATYASTRICGAMIDQLRKEARMTRSAISGRRKLAQTRNRLEQQLMRAPVPTEMAEAMGMDCDAYNSLLVSVVPAESGSVDELYSDHDPWFVDPEIGADEQIEKGADAGPSFHLCRRPSRTGGDDIAAIFRRGTEPRRNRPDIGRRCCARLPD